MTTCGKDYSGFGTICNEEHPCRSCLVAEVERLRAERDDADRRSGAAERSLEHAQDTISRHRSWTGEAKKQWGVDDSISFDKVWEECLATKRKLDDGHVLVDARELEALVTCSDILIYSMANAEDVPMSDALAKALDILDPNEEGKVTLRSTTGGA